MRATKRSKTQRTSATNSRTSKSPGDAAPRSNPDIPAKRETFDVNALSPSDRARYEAWRERVDECDVTRFKNADNGRPGVQIDGATIMGMISLFEATGAADPAFSQRLLGQISSALGGEDPAEAMNLALTTMRDFKPRDVLEGQLVGQMVGTHVAAMRFLRTATTSTDPERIGQTPGAGNGQNVT